LRDLLVPALVLLLAACGTTATTSVGPSAVKCPVTASTSGATFGHEGGSGTLVIETTRDCTWSAAVEAQWIALSASQGQGSASLAYTVSPNGVPAARSAAIRIEDRQVQVSQAAAPCRFELDGLTREVGAEGGEVTVGVATLAGCIWTAGSGATWIAVTGGAQRDGSGSARFSVAPNTGSVRTATVTVADHTVTITQQGATGSPPPAPPPPPPPPPPGCSFSLAPESRSMAAAGGAAGVSVSTTTGCSWAASSNANWITIGSGSSGTGSGQVQYAVAANASTSSRTGTLTVAGRTHTVTQQGASIPPPPPPPPPTCTYSISPQSASWEAAGGEGRVEVTSQADCAWSATSPAAWIQVTRGESATGNGEVRYTVAPNPSGTGRSGSLTIAGRTHSVEQDAGRKEEVEGRVSQLSGGCPNLTFRVKNTTVTTDASTRWDDGRCDDLRNGSEVEVEGWRAGSLVHAIEVEIETK
jgi:hypothetical protein